MAIVVTQTLPFPAPTLALANAKNRWTTLLPLFRPSIQPVRTPKGQTILVDTAHAHKKAVHIAAVGTAGNFSSKVLDERHVSALVTEQKGAGRLTAQDILHALRSVDFCVEQGVIVLRVGEKRALHRHGVEELLEVELEGELELDHVICVLGRTSESVLANVHDVQTLLRLFVDKGARTAHSRFHVERVGGNPAVVHVDGVEGFERARQVVERDLERVVVRGSQTGGEGRLDGVVDSRPGSREVTYSVHFCDVNGLSRLENYIIAGEIAQYLESQNLKYTLTHSTILDHASAARGYSISILPLASYFFAPQKTPKPHQPPTHHDNVTTTLQQILSPRISLTDAQVRKRIQAGCHALLHAEPTITAYDTIVGDGDCGYTLRDGAKTVLAFIPDCDLSRLPETLAALVHKLEVSMGGTSGALYCIFLSALVASLAREASVPLALSAATRELCRYTRARRGDRTLMDALVPFVEALVGTGDEGAAVEAARRGVEGTKGMEARLGRTAYLDEGAARGVPDPGAFGLLVLLEGMCGAG